MLGWIARQGRYALIFGLGCGFAFPGLAADLRPWVPWAISALLGVTTARIGLRQTLAGLTAAPRTLAAVLVLQLGLPLLAIALLWAAGLMGHPLAVSIVLLLAAPSLTGAPNFAAMAGGDPAPGLRLLILGTVVFPLTALPVLALVGVGGGTVQAVLWQSGKLMAVIALAGGAGFAARALLPALGSAQSRARLDGVAAILLVVAAIGLMSEVGPLARSDPGELGLWLATALGVNFGLLGAARVLLRAVPEPERLALSILAGGRNIALFLVALPPEVTAPLMVFIGCYQVPMYLTPLVVRTLEGRGGRGSASPP